MLKLCLFSVLLVFSSAAFGQFNTVKPIKHLSSVQAGVPGDSLERSPISAAVTPPRLQASMPLNSTIINSPYGSRVNPMSGESAHHGGIDFRARQDAVLSILPGKVKRAGYSQGLGSYIEIEHGAWRSIYGHLSVIFVQESMRVSAGEVIAITGSTGKSTGEHLHFAIRHRGRIVDPTPYLDLIYRKAETNRAVAPLSSPR